MNHENEKPAPGTKKPRLGLVALVAACVGLAIGTALYLTGHHGAAYTVLAALSVVAGVNTVTYEWPVVGVTPPTAVQVRTHEQVSTIITGDNSATTFTITHNWGLSTAELAAGWPEVEFEPLLSYYYTAVPTVTTKTTNTVVFTNTAFQAAAIRVRLKRPWSPTR